MTTRCYELATNPYARYSKRLVFEHLLTSHYGEEHSHSFRGPHNMKQPIPAEIIEELRKFDAATLSNAVERLDIRDRIEGFASREVRCRFPELPPLIGYAVTCTADSTYPGKPRANKLGEFIDAVEAAPKPAVVVIQNTGHDSLKSCFIGDMICAAFQKLGAVGVVSDGGYRDLEGIRKRAPGFHIFGPGCVVSHGNVGIMDIGPVTVGGMPVEPGDLLYGDDNGVLRIPNERAADVVEKAKVVHDVEGRLFDYLEKNDSVTAEDLKRALGI